MPITSGPLCPCILEALPYGCHWAPGQHTFCTKQECFRRECFQFGQVPATLRCIRCNCTCRFIEEIEGVAGPTWVCGEKRTSSETRFSNGCACGQTPTREGRVSRLFHTEILFSVADAPLYSRRKTSDIKREQGSRQALILKIQR